MIHDIDAIGVGVPVDAVGVCTFSARSQPSEICGAPATVHVISLEPRTGGRADLFGCDVHAPIARAAGADSHRFDPAVCAEGANWEYSPDDGSSTGRCTS